MICFINLVNENVLVASIEERLRVEAFTIVTMNFKGDDIDDCNEIVSAFAGRGSYTFTPKKIDLDLSNRVTQPTKPSIEEPPVLKLKALPSIFVLYS